MHPKTLFLIVFFAVCTISSYAQDTQKHAQDLVGQLSERIIITASKKDSLIMTFKSYFDDVKIYKGKGKKMMHALQVARDTEVGRILLNDAQYKEYQAFMDALVLESIRQGKGHLYGHHQ